MITDVHNRPYLDRHGKSHIQNLHVECVRAGQKGFSWRAPAAVQWLYYNLWQIVAFQTARKLQKSVEFDLVHHVSYSCLWAPSFMGYLGVPFVWNAGAAASVPFGCHGRPRCRYGSREPLRSAAVKICEPMIRACTASRAAAILSPTPPTSWKKRFPIYRFALGGLSDEELGVLGAIPVRAAGNFRVATVSRLVDGKCVELALEAFGRLYQQDCSAEYWIVGDGPERRRLEALARRLSCENGVRFWGQVERSTVWQLLAQVDVVVHPSVREEFGYAVLEALAAARPVLSWDSGGPSLILEGGGGTVLHAMTRRDAVAKLSDALFFLSNKRAARVQLALEGRRNALQTWHWDSVIHRLEAIYADAVAARNGCR